ncbi:phospholipid scramblase 1-like isoform X2 [Polistes fuscatus]|uniref:phospholipid scramblase 1-like isoform X2 n=1 Tax=Polistes fuscatus TaxID=30207 RepID=UPI001CA846C8|nr:phospholipid scramblase 1-like isoform X2 [Polistes fuscatus]
MRKGGWPATNTICPPGLEYLMGLDHLFVKQKVELFEVIVDFETKNKYKVMNIRGEQIYYVAEKSNCCSRYCCGTYRSCEFKVLDGIGREVLHMIRPLKCDSCCCPCCLQELEVYSGGVLLGSVVQDWAIFRPWFSIRNANGDTVLTIKGPLLRCLEATFKVKSADGVHRVGVISKQWSGISREIFTDADNFGISFPIDLDVKIKAVLLGACLLIDFMYFESSPN